MKIRNKKTGKVIVLKIKSKPKINGRSKLA